MCRIFLVSRSGYYKWRSRPESNRTKQNRVLDTQIKAVFKKHNGRYGSPRIAEDLKAVGLKVSKNRVARRMKEIGLKSIVRKKYRVTTDSKHSYPVAANLLQRDFLTSGPNIVWVSDITYIRTQQGWVYLTVFLDLYSRKIVGWALSDSIDSDMVITALKRAIRRRNPKAGLIIHSDRGVQYACDAFRKILDDNFFIQSMSRKGNCWDNSVAESFFNIIKSELIHHEQFRNKAEALSAIFEYIEIYYNRKRKHSTLNYQTPVQFDEYVKTASCF